MKICLVLGILLVAVYGQESTTPMDTTPMETTPLSNNVTGATTAIPESPTNETSEQSSQESAESEEYRQLEPDEVKNLLLKIIDENVDKDKDNYISADELKDWLKVLQEKVIEDNVRRQWEYYSPQSEEVHSWQGYYPETKQVVTWERYKNLTYPDPVSESVVDGTNTAEMTEVKDMMRRAGRRWKNADVDADGNLSKDEFRDYIHPEESQRAGGVVVLEAMEDMDLDKNKAVTLSEYMTHLAKVSGEEKNDPNWEATQQSHFQNYLDKDKDGSLNEEEIREWVVPSYDRSEAEAWRLISIADTDQDQRLSREEILGHHEYFLTLLPPEYWVQEEYAESSKHDEF